MLSGMPERWWRSGGCRFGVVIVVALLTCACNSSDWRTASREPAGIAPDPQRISEAVLQVYGAPAYGWRGWFAVHTWIATKHTDEREYTVYEVIGWRKRRGLAVVRIARDHPDRYWFGERPELLLDRRGEGVDGLIEAVDSAARSYPWADTYRVWPGPNSNTFTAWVAQQVPELGLELPFTAIGKGWMD
ncbi:MAG: DUF3750 domain-containing protein [Deferrisomatales bacterium]|nr:DUF3750 domain-containing protein [Deferrisomatales bacterium]